MNDSLGAYVANQLINAMLQQRLHVQGSRVLVRGLTFKEYCPDLRNTRVVDGIAELKDFGYEGDVHAPWADETEAQH